MTHYRYLIINHDDKTYKVSRKFYKKTDKENIEVVVILCHFIHYNPRIIELKSKHYIEIRDK